MKLKVGGGHAGHNGLRDIHAQMGSPDYWRLRLGIGHPGVKADVAGYVLRKPPSAERQAIDDCIHRSLAMLESLWRDDMEQAKRIIHTKPDVT
jgi:PTH1 family peptidyl-tRNA hydrolase